MIWSWVLRFIRKFIENLRRKIPMLSSKTCWMRSSSVRSRAASLLFPSTTLTLSWRMIWTRARVRRFIAPCISGTKTSWGTKSRNAVAAIQKSTWIM